MLPDFDPVTLTAEYNYFAPAQTTGPYAQYQPSYCLYPGQGSQKIGMGKDLAEAFPEARDTFAAIDDALGFSLSQVMWEGPEELLTRTDHAQPAILAHSAALWAVVGAKLKPRVSAALRAASTVRPAMASSLSPPPRDSQPANARAGLPEAL